MQRARGEPIACDSPSLSRYFLEQKFMGRAITIVCNQSNYAYSLTGHRNAVAIGDNSRHDHFTGNIVNTKASFFTCCRYNHQAVALFNNLNSSCRTDRLDTARSVDFPQMPGLSSLLPHSHTHQSPTSGTFPQGTLADPADPHPSALHNPLLHG